MAGLDPLVKLSMPASVDCEQRQHSYWLVTLWCNAAKKGQHGWNEHGVSIDISMPLSY